MAKFCLFCKNHYENIDQCPVDGSELIIDHVESSEELLNDQLTNLIVDETQNNKRKICSRSCSVNSFTSVSRFFVFCFISSFF